MGIPGEKPEQAFETARMVKSMRYADVATSYYAPYPGSVLGYQLIAEGKSLLSQTSYHRSPSNKKVKGVDYAFYRNLRMGRYKKHINTGPDYLKQHIKND